MSRERDSFSVTVERNGEQVVCISTYCLSGRDLIDGDAEVIKDAAQHLLAFVGSPDAHSAPVSGVSQQDDAYRLAILLSDLDYWRLFLLRARAAAGDGVKAPVHIDHLTACSCCIRTAITRLIEQAEAQVRDMRSAGQ